jgi:hypothetical protein
MSERPPPNLDEQLDRLEKLLPRFLSRLIHYLRKPSLRWLRTVMGVLLIIGGLLWFLPILGLEMLPLGLILIAIDIPFLRGPVARMINWLGRMITHGLALSRMILARVRGQ